MKANIYEKHMEIVTTLALDHKTELFFWNRIINDSRSVGSIWLEDWELPKNHRLSEFFIFFESNILRFQNLRLNCFFYSLISC